MSAERTEHTNPQIETILKKREDFQKGYIGLSDGKPLKISRNVEFPATNETRQMCEDVIYCTTLQLYNHPSFAKEEVEADLPKIAEFMFDYLRYGNVKFDDYTAAIAKIAKAALLKGAGPIVVDQGGYWSDHAYQKLPKFDTPNKSETKDAGSAAVTTPPASQETSPIMSDRTRSIITPDQSQDEEKGDGAISRRLSFGSPAPSSSGLEQQSEHDGTPFARHHRVALVLVQSRAHGDGTAYAGPHVPTDRQSASRPEKLSFEVYQDPVLSPASEAIERRIGLLTSHRYFQKKKTNDADTISGFNDDDIREICSDPGTYRDFKCAAEFFDHLKHEGIVEEVLQKQDPEDFVVFGRHSKYYSNYKPEDFSTRDATQTRFKAWAIEVQSQSDKITQAKLEKAQAEAASRAAHEQQAARNVRGFR